MVTLLTQFGFKESDNQASEMER